MNEHGCQFGDALNPRYTFESFVVGKENELAHKTALMVVDNYGECGPVYFTGANPGLGMTHLLQAIAWKVAGDHPGRSTAYVFAETFTTQYQRSLPRDRAKEFLHYFAEVDYFMLDDFHLIARKPSWRKLLLSIMEKRVQQGKMMVLGGVKSQDISGLDERFRSMLAGFRLVEISPPGYDLRMAILRQIQGKTGTCFGDDILEQFARNITFSVRHLEGAMARLGAYVACGGDATAEHVTKLLALYKR